MNYLHWNEITIPDDSSAEYITDKYGDGYLFTRKGKGIMHRTRSVRIDLNKFETSSENKRVMKKSGVFVASPEHYNWEIGKMAKDFYETKFGIGVMSANKIKEMVADAAKSNFNYLMGFCTQDLSNNIPIGYTVCYRNNELLHYSYPFYDLKAAPKDMGLGMMTNAIRFSKEAGLKYIYLGSLQRPGDTYKLQFAGLEWFDGGPDGSGKWSTDIDKVKKVLTKTDGRI